MDISFPRDPSSVRAARGFVVEAVADCPSDTAHSAELLTSELATNAIVHANAAFVLTVDHDGTVLRIAVTDHGDGTPALGNPEPDDDHGRGLLFIERLAVAWGVDVAPGGGKQVWFELPC